MEKALFNRITNMSSYMTDENALRMLIAAKDSQYKKMLQAAFSSKLYGGVSQTSLNFFSGLPKYRSIGKFLWIYADSISQIMTEENISYTEVVRKYFFIDEHPKPLPAYVAACYDWAKCLYDIDRDRNYLLNRLPNFDKTAILFELTFEEIGKYIETIELKPCLFAHNETTVKLKALSDFKNKMENYLNNKNTQTRKALAESATQAASLFPKTEEIDELDKAKNVTLGVLLGLLGLVLLVPTLGVGAAYAWRGAYAFFKECEGTRSNLEEIKARIDLEEIEQSQKSINPPLQKYQFTL